MSPRVPLLLALALAPPLGACAGAGPAPARAAVANHTGSTTDAEASDDEALARVAPALEAVRALAEPLWSLPADAERLGRVCAKASELRDAAVALERAPSPLDGRPAAERASAHGQQRMEAWVMSAAFITVAADRLTTECPGVRPSDLDADLSSLRTSVTTMIDVARGGDGDAHHDHDHHAP